MMRAKARISAIALALPLALGGCDLLFPEDPRLGVEPLEKCLARLDGDMDMFGFRELSETPDWLVPTYTYDITMLSFEAKQALIQPGADETLGSRLMSQTNEASTAMAAFMATPVDEKGAFFFGVEPALWRVRGEALRHADILTTGCEQQTSGMRLLRVSVARSANATAPAPEPVPDTDTPPPASENRT